MAARIVSYNLLSDRLCQREWYVHCTQRNLEPARRLAAIEDSLAAEMRASAIICMQEVSTAFAGRLAVFFEAHGYHFRHDHYAGRGTGWMGVAIAYPQAAYALEAMQIEEPTDERWVRESHAEVQQKRAPLPPGSAIGRVASTVLAIVGGALAVKSALFAPVWLSVGVDAVAAAALLWSASHGLASRPAEPQKSAEQEYYELLTQVTNRLLMLKLRDKRHDAPFWCCTYHMPCKFRNGQAMCTFAALLAQRVQSIVAGDAYILAGDFNFTPNSPSYGLLTSGRLPRSSLDYPTARKVEKRRPSRWQPRVEPLASAYVLATGSEPEVTNHSATRQRNGEMNRFTDCLDFIFLSPHWSAKDCKQTPTRESVGDVRSFPNAYEPSDHVMIGCSVHLKKIAKASNA